MIAEDIILLLSYPDSEMKLKILRDLIGSIRSTTSFPVALATHWPIPEDIIRKVDYFIYDADDRPGENFNVYYHHTIPGDVTIKTKRFDPYHALSCINSIKNGATFLRNKFRHTHFFEHDSLINFPRYISVVQDKLKKAKFVGMQYEVPSQKIHGIVGNYFSFDTKWYDDHIPEISTWDEYKSYARDEKDGLLAECWLYHFFAVYNLMRDCYFLSSKEQQGLNIKGDVKVIGDVEPALFAYLSELVDHRLILFAHLYCPNGRSLDLVVNHNGNRENVRLTGTVLYWKVIEKTGCITVKSAEQSHVFDIDPAKEYTDTIFKFENNRMRCLKEID